MNKLVNRIIAENSTEEALDAPMDRRLTLRLPADERPFEAYFGGDDPQIIWLEDVSRSGMRFRSEYPYPCGSVLVVTAPPSFQLDPVQARIVRAQLVDPSTPERGFEYGAEYVYENEQPHAWYLATRARR